jgi:predicted CXXCH cytochrome family protein
MPKHIINLLVLLAVALLVALIARTVLIDPSFYRFGTFRADAVPELAAGEPLFQGSAYCGTCHVEGHDAWLKGRHVRVQCEVCHGPDNQHPDNGKSLVRSDSIRFCTLCHLAMPSRPSDQPQIVLADHPSADEAMQQCHDCHDPHSPGDPEPEQSLVGVGSVDSGIDVVPKCAKCHGKKGEGKRKNPALAGTEPGLFFERMQIYKNDDSKSKAMFRYANSLSDDEVRALASYYESLAPDPLP